MSSDKTRKGMRFYVVGPNDKLVRTMLHRYGHQSTQRRDIPFDVGLFTGGADISPFLYGEKKLPTTHVNYERDMQEIKEWQYLGTGFPKVGICRGAQLLNVLSGGSLWQDVNAHYTTKGPMIHDMKDISTGVLVPTTSTHHQMMRVGQDGVVVAAAHQSTVKKAANELITIEKPETGWNDPEVVWYSDTTSLCIQGHPEYHNTPKEFISYFFDMIDKYLGPIINGEMEKA